MLRLRQKILWIIAIITACLMLLISCIDCSAQIYYSTSNLESTIIYEPGYYLEVPKKIHSTPGIKSTSKTINNPIIRYTPQPVYQQQFYQPPLIQFYENGFNSGYCSSSM